MFLHNSINDTQAQTLPREAVVVKKGANILALSSTDNTIILDSDHNFGIFLFDGNRNHTTAAFFSQPLHNHY
ncbi:MAG: hypothetical protein JRJ43_07510 [Deltaproteobacteria bacterium]|nr:hypothetical protein [Deltaproteobacteria bacterium]